MTELRAADGSTLRTVERAVRLLQYVALSGEPVGTRESARVLAISPSSAHRLLRTLSDLGVLEQDDLTSDFRPGLEFYRLAANVMASSGLTQAARSPMKRLARETGEAVYFSLRHGDKRVVIDSVPGWRQLQYTLPLGEEVSLHVGSSGLAILAWLPETELEALIERGLPGHSSRTITDPQELRRSLQLVRSQGYASTFGQHTEEGVGVSAPIFGAHSDVVGSLLLTIPVTRLETHGPLDQIGRSVRCTADEISLRLGGRSGDC